MAKGIPRGKELIPLISEAALDKKADDVTVLNLKRESGIADYFVICQGDNPHHNRAIRDSIVDELGERGVFPWHSEGEQDGRWILIDYSDVVVHIMIPLVREYYALEELWPASPPRSQNRPPHE
ncbi:MAG TPA: ribosome silencing factor [Chitinivibrionales bacterium]|nr:ribosome silencing factor [Chitinivibrionales bacterium]